MRYIPDVVAVRLIDLLRDVRACDVDALAVAQAMDVLDMEETLRYLSDADLEAVYTEVFHETKRRVTRG